MLMLGFGMMGTTPGAIVATFPESPRLILGYLLTDDPAEAAPLTIDLNGDGTGDVFFKGGGPMIDFFVTDGNRALVVAPPPPNLGGLAANLPAGSIIGAGSMDSGVFRWYGGFPAPGIAESYGLPLDIHAMAFSDLNTHGNNGYFFNASGYIGIEIQIEGQPHFGWIHITNETGMGHGGYVDAWAYESEPSQPIRAGQVPEPEVFLLLVCCAVMVFRRRAA